MGMKALMILLLMLPAMSHAKFYKVAVIDTGLNLNDVRFQKVLCKDHQHWDFVSNSDNLVDAHGHGTHVAGLIMENAGKSTNYCLNIYRYYVADASSTENASRYVKALIKAVTDGSNLINISGGGPESLAGEFEVIKAHPEVTFVVAAGNDNQKLLYNYFPAAYKLKNVIVVGGLNFYCKKTSSSNYGSRVDFWEKGENVKSTVPGGYAYLTGTSQATAIHTGKIISGNLKQDCPYSTLAH